MVAVYPPDHPSSGGYLALDHSSHDWNSGIPLLPLSEGCLQAFFKAFP